MSTSDIISWHIPLLGHAFDLEDLPEWLTGQPVHVTLSEGHYVLVIPASVVGTDYGPVRAFAETQLALINGVGRTLSSDFRPLSLDDKIFGMDAGGKRHIVLAVDGAELRMKGGVVRMLVNGEEQPDPRRGLAGPLLRASAHSQRAHDALMILGRPNLTWSELYLLFELVESDVSGQMFTNQWISQADADRFTHTANSYSVLRSHGRHGKDRGQAPTAPMAIGTAVTLIRGLVLSWLRYRGRTGDSTSGG